MQAVTPSAEVGPNPLSLMLPASCNRGSMVRELLQRGAQPSARNNDGLTALLEA